eukprot:2924045-Karenia_brevis.AAC.1
MASLSRSSLKLLKIQPRTPEFQSLVDGGRVQLIGILLPGDVLMLVLNVYGWTNGHTCIHASHKTNDLLSVALRELDSHPR